MFLLSQLPPWQRGALPAPNDRRYPRSPSFRVMREIGNFLWLPLVAYFTIAVANAIQLVVKTGAHLGALFDVSALSHIFLLDRLIPEDQQSTLLLALGADLFVFIGMLVIVTLARRDRIREMLAVAIREEVLPAHAGLVGRVNETIWQPGGTPAGKLAQSAQHLQDMSLATAKRMMLRVLGREVKHLSVSLALLVAVVVVGLVFVVTGIA